jgi:hypothetical protein
MKTCWLCEQKAEHAQERLKTAQVEAQKKADYEKTTIAIWKEGPIYKTGIPSAAGINPILEYISESAETAIA